MLRTAPRGTRAKFLMKLYRPPELIPANELENSLFMAGGITGAADWQVDLANNLSDTDLTLLNPRREHYSALDPNALREQIKWEHDGLRHASAISFWFPAGAQCLISLYELGSWAHWRDSNGEVKLLFVAVHPDYARHEDIIIQMELERPDITVLDSLEPLTTQILAWQSSQ